MISKFFKHKKVAKEASKQLKLEQQNRKEEQNSGTNNFLIGDETKEEENDASNSRLSILELKHIQNQFSWYHYEYLGKKESDSA